MPQRRTGRIDRHGKGWRFQIKIDGERIRRTFESRSEAEAALASLLGDLERDASVELARKIGRITVADVVHLYYSRRKPHLELSTCARYEAVMRKYILPQIGPVAAKDVAATPLLLEDWLGTIPWGQARKALEILNPAFRLARDNGLIACNPVDKIRRPKRPDKRRKKHIPTPSEAEKIVIAAYEEDVWWGYFVELVSVLGLRRSEACALRWEDFVFPRNGSARGSLHVRRSVGKKDGGIYIKAPKSGLPRELLVDKSLFEGLDYFDGATGWVFPGRDCGAVMTLRSTAGRLLVYLLEQGGSVGCPAGRAGSTARKAIGTNSATLSQVMRELLSRSLVTRDSNARRTFTIELTDRGRSFAEELSSREDADQPVHPDTMGHRFEAMIARLGLVASDGKPYTLHSLRHYRATHLYNASKDWVQVARYLGHSSPAITMELYANNVVSATQALLADSAIRYDQN